MTRGRAAIGKAATVLAIAVLPVALAAAQQVPPTDGGMTQSLGQPDRWNWTAGVGLGWGGRHEGVDNGGTASGHLGVHSDLMNPVLGAGGLNFEVYAGARDTRPNGGVRARIASPALRVGIGIDYNVIDHEPRLLTSLYSPVMRGGFFNNGTELRLDVLPGRSPQFIVSLETPVFRRIPAGTTRPAIDHVKLSRFRGATLPAPSLAPRLKDPLARARAAAAVIRQLNVPYIDLAPSLQSDDGAFHARVRALKEVLAAHPDSQPPIEVHVRRFHAEIARAFAIAVSGSSVASPPDQGPAAAARAREILLEHVLFPYDRLIGQVKIPDSTEEFARRARAAFMRWLVAEPSLSPDTRDAAAWVFASVLDIVEENRAALRQEWRDSRFIWLPLQYGLLPEQHDSQEELDALMQQAVGVRFSDGNALSYVINEQFQYQLSRTIHAARDYHVLWIHDFRGKDAGGDPDAMSYAHVLQSYLAALTQRVRDYDRTGRMPTFIILLDEWFYQVNNARLWMTLLEDPTGHHLELPRQQRAWEEAVRRGQDSLRLAIAQSHLLQSQRAQFGDRWLRNLIKVHVNVTNASDPSFWSWRVARFFPIFDNLIRDHRKLAFYDVTEEDPYRGEALFTGAGVGEHYATSAWEDRALLVRGPALLGLKNAARAALLQQGMKTAHIPWSLQPRELAPDYSVRVASFVSREQQSLRALVITNETGFGAKQINAAKGVLYTLMPSGSVVKIPDSLWNSAFWGSALLGCALRGVRVLVIGPALENAPAPAFGSMIRSYELFLQLLVATRKLQPEIARAGGLLRVGVFSTQVPATDVGSKVRAVRRTFAEQEWLRTLFGFSPLMYEELARLTEERDHATMSVRQLANFEAGDRPKLHLKANFFASREAWTLMSRPEWAQMMRQFVGQRQTQVQLPFDSLGSLAAVPPALEVGREAVTDWFAQLTRAERSRVVFYTIMGSQNQNARSMVQDGEVAIVVSSWPSIIPYLDLLTIIGQSRWIEEPADLAALLPPHGALKRKVAHWGKLAF